MLTEDLTHFCPVTFWGYYCNPVSVSVQMWLFKHHQIVAFFIYSICKTVCIPLGCFSLFYIKIYKYIYVNTRKMVYLKGKYCQKYFKYIKSIGKLMGVFVIFFFLMAYLNYWLIRFIISFKGFGLQLQRVNTEHKLYWIFIIYCWFILAWFGLIFFCLLVIENNLSFSQISVPCMN